MGGGVAKGWPGVWLSDPVWVRRAGVQGLYSLQSTGENTHKTNPKTSHPQKEK